MMAYRSAHALEMAVKDAAKNSEMDTGRAVSGFYFHRLLCRIFADGNDSFVLKGGQGMLARTIDARATRDIDLISMRSDLESALADLKRLAQKDLDDFVSFEYVDAHPIKVDDEYRSGVSVQFAPSIGAKRMQDISIDLVVDELPLESVEAITPADRIEVRGIFTCDYLVYPVENALSDKLCAMAERHEGRASSRVKDLVDIAVYATTCDVNGLKLQESLQKELAVRRIGDVTAFAIPEEWDTGHARQFAKLCRQTGLPESFRALDSAAALASNLLDPALQRTTGESYWNHAQLKWMKG